MRVGNYRNYPAYRLISLKRPITFPGYVWELRLRPSTKLLLGLR